MQGSKVVDCNIKSPVGLLGVAVVNGTQNSIRGFLEFWRDYLVSGKSAKKPVVVTGKALGALEGMKRVFLEYDIECVTVGHLGEISGIPEGKIGLCVLDIEQGFECDEFIMLADELVFGKAVLRFGSKRKEVNLKKLLIQAHSFKAGDLVTHLDHGIGIFEGIEAMDYSGQKYEMVKLRYKGKNVLYVPMYMIDRVSKYNATSDNLTDEEKESLLDGLSSASLWKRRRDKVKKNLLEIAGKIIDTVAKRKLIKAESFFPVAGLLESFEEGFPFVPTEDQVGAIQDVYADLSSGSVMDRLICGDVGYGKTEVAMRAAFMVVHGMMLNLKGVGYSGDVEISERNMKSVAEAVSEGAPGKYGQVAVIVPTTILARQHRQNFIKRFEGFGVRVAEISRTISNSQKREILRDLESGAIDIVIGTHAMLSDKVKFKKLDLLIVDEEQHFGVKQKEKIKQNKPGVHVLLLSATPIPRTLQMSLSGLRDLSIIATPPFDRLMPKSFLIPFDKMVIHQAVMRERTRSGRVFFVCPRIKDLELQFNKLQEIFDGTDIRIGRAHGQMPVSEMEDAMIKFFDGKYDILITTNIIESGLDISFANTIFIHNAEMFGMSALHQLRGRVGRSNVQAYAYFIVDTIKMQNKNLLYRLKNLLDIENVAAGFKVASFDMDIRGAGNILGDKQSGHINEVGVELYNNMLNEAVDSMKSGNGGSGGVEHEEEWVPEVKIGLSIFIPEDYIADFTSRVDMYRRMASAGSNEELNDLISEMADRFGAVPKSILNLCDVVSLKMQCKELGVRRIEVGIKGVRIVLDEGSGSRIDKVFLELSRPNSRFVLRPDSSLFIPLRNELSKGPGTAVGSALAARGVSALELVSSSKVGQLDNKEKATAALAKKFDEQDVLIAMAKESVKILKSL